ncbi:hypothetical protein BKA70DRAFT_145887 [Coprinopsis sp. MPI-PUGE-AT-0042]|nr:hypothetical protein BKA70DRAFT_145887 [Coprinopsis sp. MPI-PUGE-AT-0042]
MVHTSIAVVLAAFIAAPAFAAPVALALEARYPQDMDAHVPHHHRSLRETARVFDPFDIKVRMDDGKANEGKGKAKDKKRRIRLKAFDYRLIDQSALEIVDSLRRSKPEPQRRHSVGPVQTFTITSKRT